MTVLVSGSMAFDHLLRYQGNFLDQIKKGDLDALSVAFLTPELNKQFGGCAGNICYNLNQIGLDSVAIATVGADFEVYAKWLEKNNLNQQFLVQLEDCYTAQAFIISDSFNHQITAFHPGAMDYAQKSVIAANQIKEIGIEIGLVSPNGKKAMIDQAEELAKANVPFIFDPGQGLPQFDGSELKRLIELASWVIVNHFESQMLTKNLNHSALDIAKQLKALIITNSEKGCQIISNNEIIQVDAVKVEKAIDPTGCGDAFRSGLVYGILNQLSWQQTAELSNVIGSIKVQSQGTQNHQLDQSQINALYQQTYRKQLNLDGIN